MGNNKLRFNNLKDNLKKVGRAVERIVPSIALAAFFSCATPKEAINNQIQNKGNNENSTIELTVPDSRTIYQATAEIDFLGQIIKNNLYQITKYDYNKENEVEEELVNIAINKALASEKTANAYEQEEDRTVANSGMGLEEITRIAQLDAKERSQVNDDIMRHVVTVAMQHDIHLCLDSLSLGYLNAESLEKIKVIKLNNDQIDEHDKKNEYEDFIECNKLTSNKNDGYDVRGFMRDALKYNMINIIGDDKELGAIRYFYKLQGKSGEDERKALLDCFDKIEALAKIKNLTSTQYQNMLKTIDDAAQILCQAGGFGNIEMCRGLVANRASTYVLINIQDHLAEFGYDINHIKPETYEKIANQKEKEENTSSQTSSDLRPKPFFYANAGATVTNTHLGLNVGVGGNLPLNKNLALDAQIKADTEVSYKGKNETTITADLGADVTFGNNNIGVMVINGATFMWDKNPNPSYNLGGKIKYMYKFNDFFSFGAATELTHSFKQEKTNLVVGTFARFSFGNSPFKLITNLNGGWTFVDESIREIRPGTEAPESEQLPDEPIYGAGDITPLTPGSTTPQGRPKEGPLDITRF
ncbi:MAG: hypothetical protein MJ060_00430 [Clostridia bacterium]|nr:hypothetical protein [Clostridia bacterium]